MTYDPGALPGEAGASGKALTRRMLSDASLGSGSGISVEPDGKAYVQFRNDLCLILAPSGPRLGEADATWDWSLNSSGWDASPPLAAGTAVSSAEMLRVLQENADSARGPGGMTSLEFCEAALAAGAAEACMLPAESPGGVPRPGGRLPDGRGFIITDEADLGFPDAVFHVPDRLHLQIYLPGESRVPGDFGEPDGTYADISAEQALAVIQEPAAARGQGSVPSAAPGRAARRRPGPGHHGSADNPPHRG